MRNGEREKAGRINERLERKKTILNQARTEFGLEPFEGDLGEGFISKDVEDILKNFMETSQALAKTKENLTSTQKEIFITNCISIVAIIISVMVLTIRITLMLV